MNLRQTDDTGSFCRGKSVAGGTLTSESPGGSRWWGYRMAEVLGDKGQEGKSQNFLFQGQLRERALPKMEITLRPAR